jgi:hypothetical protein
MYKKKTFYFSSLLGGFCPVPVHNTTLCDKVCQWLATGRLFSPCTLVSYTNKTVRHDIAEILLKVALNTITPSPFKVPKTFIFYLFYQRLTYYISKYFPKKDGNPSSAESFHLLQCFLCLENTAFSLHRF